jgi:hypothetical protein
MRMFWATTLTALMISGVTLAQEAPSNNASPATQGASSTTQGTPGQPGTASQANSSQANGAPKIAPGSVIPVQLTKSIDAKKVKTGDPVEAKVTQDLKTSSGVLVVPKDTKVLGHVTEAQARSKEQKESQLGIAFDRAVIKNAGDVPLPMSIQAVIVPPSQNNNAGGEGTSQAGGYPGGGAPGNARNNGAAGAPSQSPTASSAAPESDSQAGTNPAPQQITGDTQGVVGMANVKLSAAPNGSQGSVLSSEKNNVKLESGTVMLLRVNQ